MNHSNAVDCTVVGAGPAGISVALWLRTFDVDFRWVTRGGRIGGILSRVHNAIDGYPGGGVYPHGEAMVDDLEDHLDAIEELSPEARTIASIERADGLWQCHTDSGRRWHSKTVVLTTGTSYRRLGVPGEGAGLGDCVSQSVSRDGEAFARRTVGMVGGGDAGFEGALELADLGCHVHMLLRNDDFRARPAFVEPVEAHPKISFHPIPTEVERIESLPDPRGCRVHLDVDGSKDTLEVACLFVRIGVEPVVPEVVPEPETDDRGHLVVDRRQHTSVEGLLAAGDVTDTQLPAVPTAVGDGARAAHAAATRLGYV